MSKAGAILRSEHPSLTYFEFFAGGGMVSAGLGARWTCGFANDICPDKAASWRANWGDDGPLVVSDVAALSSADLPGRPDLVWASSPCQDLSLAGRREGLGGERSGAFWPFWRLMQEMAAEGRAPRIVAIENVAGLMTSNDGRDLAAMVATLAQGGWRVGALAIDAALFTPQSRPRLFVLGFGPGVEPPADVLAAGPVAPWHPPSLAAAATAAGGDWLWLNPSPPPTRNIALADLIERNPADAPWRPGPWTERLIAMMAPIHRARLAAALADSRRGPVVGAVYRRTRVERGVKRQRAELRLDGLAGCLRTPRGGSSRQFLAVIEDGALRVRHLSARECARLMGLPDSFVMPTGATRAAWLAGDGVAAPVVRFLADTVFEPALADRMHA